MEDESIPGVRTIAAVSLFWTTALGGSAVIAALTSDSTADAVGFALLGVLFLVAGAAFARYAVLELIGPAREMEILRPNAQGREREPASEEERRAA